MSFMVVWNDPSPPPHHHHHPQPHDIPFKNGDKDAASTFAARLSFNGHPGWAEGRGAGVFRTSLISILSTIEWVPLFIWED